MIFVALVIFFAFGMLAIDFIQAPFTNTKMKPIEPFTGAPSRASDCRCLSGYVPSNQLPKVKNGGKIIHYSGTHMYVPAGTKDKWWVSNCSMCGINFCDKREYVDIDKKEYDSYTFKGQLTCNIVEKAKNARPLDTFFCQRLGDPTDRKECY